jgi:hypothetical protein
MGKIIDITGHRFGKLVALHRTANAVTSRNSVWLCQCDCGNTHATRLSRLRDGTTKSCGCAWHPEKHGYAKLSDGPRHYLYNLWSGIIDRCTNPNSIGFERYKDRGVCDRWRDSFPDFLADILAEIGERPSSRYSLDRRDNEAGYKPGNVRWATAKEQAENSRPKRWTRWSGRPSAN